MFGKNRNKKVGLCLMVVTACLVLAGLWAVLAVPETALADHKPGHDKPGGGGGKDEPIIFTVDVVEDRDRTEQPTYLYLPTCSAETRGGGFSAWFARHDLCATVVTSTGATLTDDIGLQVETNKDGNIISFQLFGQDVIGRDGIMHQSEVVAIWPPVVPSMDGFTLHVDVDNLEIWKTNHHLRSNKPKLVKMIGEISVGDLVYTPVQQ
ncbi:MAG: hypothetical protein IIB56_09205 [Planctomycetes bacterium]|nr:hypothetical protein [Planctomycetota bacterium]MCH8120090.1 hypothetical protein [Planctomycetota bacterium]